jgi:Ca2+-binding RTX toxin-like protein
VVAVAEAQQDEDSVPFTLSLRGTSGPNEIYIQYSIASGKFLITANGVLHQPYGDDGKPISACARSPSGNPNRLSCGIRAIGGFEVDAGAGNDTVIVGGRVRVSATLRGGAGNDDLAGGGNTDKLLGGPGHDKLAGRGGADFLYGGPHRDTIFGGPGQDVLLGGPGRDLLLGGFGRDIERHGRRSSGARRGGSAGTSAG